MREKIIAYETSGQLIVEENTTIEDVRCTYESDTYSNKDMKGTFHFRSIPREIIKLRNIIGKKFTFNGDNGIYIVGKIRGFKDSLEINFRKYEIHFKIQEMEKWIEFSDKKAQKVQVYFNIPYVKPFGRDVRYGKGKIILKYMKNELKLNTAPYQICIMDDIGIIDLEEPNASIIRNIYLKIESTILNEQLKDKLNDIEQFMNNAMICISFMIFHRVNWFGYNSCGYDAENKITETLFYKHKKYEPGTDFITTCTDEFCDYFTKRNISLFINRFSIIPSVKKTQLKRIVNSFLSIKEIRIFEAKFKTIFSVVEGISKLVVEKKKIKFKDYPKTNEFISKVMKVAKINIKFENSVTNKMKWIITDYRNDLTHFNSTEIYDKDLLYKEFKKLMVLGRKLILFYIEKKLVEFPYPENIY